MKFVHLNTLKYSELWFCMHRTLKTWKTYHIYFVKMSVTFILYSPFQLWFLCKFLENFSARHYTVHNCSDILIILVPSYPTVSHHHHQISLFLLLRFLTKYHPFWSPATMASLSTQVNLSTSIWTPSFGMNVTNFLPYGHFQVHFLVHLVAIFCLCESRSQL